MDLVYIYVKYDDDGNEYSSMHESTDCLNQIFSGQYSRIYRLSELNIRCFSENRQKRKLQKVLNIPAMYAHLLELEKSSELLKYHEEACLYGLNLLDMTVRPCNIINPNRESEQQ